MIHDQFTSHGYDVQLVDGFELRITNPNGRVVTTLPAVVKKDARYKDFIKMRKEHRRSITMIKHKIIYHMSTGYFVSVGKILANVNGTWRGNVKRAYIYDIFISTKDMYVETETGEKGFISGYDERGLKINGKSFDRMRVLHPSDIPNLQEVQIQAIKEMRIQHIMQLFRPIYIPNPDEEGEITRFAGQVVDAKQLKAILYSYGWAIPRMMPNVAMKKFGDYIVSFTMTKGFCRAEKFDVGNIQFLFGRSDIDLTNMAYEFVVANHKMTRDVPKQLFSEVAWEVEKAITACGAKISEQLLDSRKSLAIIYMGAMGVSDYTEIEGHEVKVYGHYGLYGVSLVDAISYWWKDKTYICLQPHSYASTGKDNPQEEAVIVGEEDQRADKTLALAMSKVYALVHDDTPVDDTLGNQLKPHNYGVSRKGENLELLRKQIEEKKHGEKKWQW